MANERGFTLIEMLAAICISALLLGVLAEFLFSCTGLWAKSDRGYQREQQLKFIYQMLERDFISIYPGTYLGELPAIEGDETRCAFWLETGQGLVRVQYRYDQENGKVYRVSGVAGSDPTEKTLFDDVTIWKIEYYDAFAQNWLLQWQVRPTEREILPKLLRVSVQTKLANFGTLTFPIKAWRPEAKPNE